MNVQSEDSSSSSSVLDVQQLSSTPWKESSPLELEIIEFSSNSRDLDRLGFQQTRHFVWYDHRFWCFVVSLSAAAAAAAVES
jgi:hypothetical protein